MQGSTIVVVDAINSHLVPASLDSEVHNFDRGGRTPNADNAPLVGTVFARVIGAGCTAILVNPAETLADAPRLVAWRDCWRVRRRSRGTRRGTRGPSWNERVGQGTCVDIEAEQRDEVDIAQLYFETPTISPARPPRIQAGDVRRAISYRCDSMVS